MIIHDKNVFELTSSLAPLELAPWLPVSWHHVNTCRLWYVVIGTGGFRWLPAQRTLKSWEPGQTGFKKYRLAHRSASRDGRWAERDNAKRSYLSMSADNAFAAWAKIAIYKCHLGFYSKTSFRPSYCQISTDLYKILHTAIAVRNTLVSRPRPGSAPVQTAMTTCNTNTLSPM